MKKLLLFVMILCAATVAFSQNLTAPAERINRCGSYDVYKQMLQSDPFFARNQQSIENFTKNFIAKNTESAMRVAQGTPLYIIPVVVHVVYNTAVQNISDAQIQSQIDVLNKDYQKLNTDVGQVPSVWTGLVADCQIQFCLAVKDPNGNATTGIRRVSTTKTSFNINNNVKYTSKGGDDAWPAADYLNLWVCKLGGGLLGYAQFPGGNAKTDGVVITYSGFGTIGTAKSPYNLGRSATHEIGHWLNLKHIWGDDGSRCTGSDLVDDTPNQADEHYGCPQFPQVSCTNNPNGDMYVNYMDYTDDRCMFMFSNGQKDRMYATLITGGAHHSVTISGKCASQLAAINNHTIIKSILSIIPNPVTSGLATVEFKLDKAAQVKLIVSDVYGNNTFVINAGTQTAGEHRLNPLELTHLGNGIYIIKLIADEQQLSTTRFVVNK